MLVSGTGSQRIEATKDDNNDIYMNNTIEIYRSQDGSIQLNVKLENETVWLTQSQMAELFDVDRTSIVRHIRNIYKSEELDEISTCAKNTQVRKEGHRQILREIPHYYLEMLWRLSNHSFSDGNKRIAAMLFLWFLSNNHVLYAKDGHKRITDNTLVALTLMIAESRTEEKDVMVKVVVNLINKDN